MQIFIKNVALKQAFKARRMCLQPMFMTVLQELRILFNIVLFWRLSIFEFESHRYYSGVLSESRHPQRAARGIFISGTQGVCKYDEQRRLDV